MKSSLVNFPEKQEYPFRSSLLTLTFETEIKRIARECEKEVGEITKILATVVGVHERQIYNYRSGKTAIPEPSILKFCLQFKSLALAAAWMREGQNRCSIEPHDLIRLANQTTRQTLKVGDCFLEAFDDGVIDGFELAELNKAAAAGIANFERLREIAENEHQRCCGVAR